jgi:hypothetical protein
MFDWLAFACSSQLSFTSGTPSPSVSGPTVTVRDVVARIVPSSSHSTRSACVPSGTCTGTSKESGPLAVSTTWLAASAPST